jgi:hypothetical protein
VPDRPGFALAIVHITGLDPEVCLGWSYFENTDASEALRPFNWLNWKDAPDLHGPFVSHDPAKDGGTIPGYATFGDALADFGRRIALPKYAAIRASAGKTKQEQVDAIIASAWGTKHLTWRAFSTSQAKWTWLSFYLGHDWAHAVGIKAAPDIFPQPVPQEWWDELARHQP